MMWFLLITAIISAALIVVMRYSLRFGNDSSQKLVPSDMNELCVRVMRRINTVLEEDYSTWKLSEVELRKKLNARDRLKSAVKNACLGDSGEREYLKDYIKELVMQELQNNYGILTTLIPFDNPSLMTPRDKFEYMYMCYMSTNYRDVFASMMSDFMWEDQSEINDKDINEAYCRGRMTGDYNDMLSTVVQRVYEELYGHGCADLLIADSSVDSVSAGVGGRTRLEYDFYAELTDGQSKSSRFYDTVYCVFKGRTIRMKFLSFGSEEGLERVVKNIYRYNCPSTLSVRNPVINATMKNNSRVMVSRPPVSDGYAFYVRKYTSSSPTDIKSLLVHEGAQMVIDFLISLIRAECSFCISGNTGGGKTTLLKSLVAYINPLYTIRVVESSFELNLNNLYPERNIHVLQERGDFSIYDAITATKKMDTDVLLIGEVNEPKVAGAFIQVSQSGSRMAITTLHHESAKKLIEYMRNALVCEFGITDVNVAERQVVDSISFDVHMVHDTHGRHYIERITQIIPLDHDERGNYLCRDIIVFDHERLRYRKVSEVSADMKKRMEGVRYA